MTKAKLILQCFGCSELLADDHPVYCAEDYELADRACNEAQQEAAHLYDALMKIEEVASLAIGRGEPVSPHVQRMRDQARAALDAVDTARSRTAAENVQRLKAALDKELS